MSGLNRREAKKAAFVAMLQGMGFDVDSRLHVKLEGTSVVRPPERTDYQASKNSFLFWKTTKHSQQVWAWVVSSGFQATFLKALQYDESLPLTPIGRAVIIEKVKQFNRAWKRKGERK